MQAVLARLLQSLPQQQEDVAWNRETRRGVGDGSEEGKNADTFIGTDGTPALTSLGLRWAFLL